MDPRYAMAAQAIARWALTLAAGYLVQRGIWTNEIATEFVGGASIAVVTIAWSLWEHSRSRAKLLTAIASSTVMNEHEVEAMVKNGLAPAANTPKDALPRLG